MKEIKLTKDRVALIDDEDFERLNRFKWYANWDGYNWYAIRNSPMRNGKRVKIHMHREILNTTEGIKIDHRNGDGLYNLKENLRLCTHQQNGFNRRLPQKNNKLGIKGVYWHKQNKKFSAQIKINGKVIYLGCFNVMGDADQAYRVAEIKYFGEFAREELKNYIS